MSALEELWFGTSLAARLARAALAPASALYGAGVRLRSASYAHGVRRVHLPPIPVLSVGNLSVGGTGKTPVTAWAAARLRERGASPAVVLRGYGGDEVRVHALLNPGIPVIASPDRAAGVLEAQHRGADCAVLDDAFQHRRVARTVDWVLVPAEQGVTAPRLLPAGPGREPASALRRATVVIVTRKSAPAEGASALAAAIERDWGVPAAVCHLAPEAVVDARTRVSSPPSHLRGARVVAVAAVGSPTPFFEQLRSAGAVALRTHAYRDHHAFGEDDVRRLVLDADGADAVVCTLKDAVKLAPLWPRDAVPLWYVSQHARIELGEESLAASLAGILSARASSSSTAGDAG